MYLAFGAWENKADGLSLGDRCPHQKTVTVLDTFPAILAKIFPKRKNIPCHFAYICINLHTFGHLLSRSTCLPILKVALQQNLKKIDLKIPGISLKEEE